MNHKIILLSLMTILFAPITIVAQETHTVQEVSVQDQNDLQTRINPTLLEIDYLTTGEISLPFVNSQKHNLSDCVEIFPSGNDTLGIVRRLKKDGSFAGYKTGSFEMFRQESGTTVTDYRFVFTNDLKEQMLRAYFRVEAEDYYPVNALIFGSNTWHMITNDIPKLENCVALKYGQVRMKKRSSAIESFGKDFSTQVGETYTLKYLTSDANVKETGWVFDTGEQGFQCPYNEFFLLVCAKEVLFVYPFNKKFKNPVSVSVDVANSPHGSIAASGIRIDPKSWTYQAIPTKLDGNKYAFEITEGGIYNVVPSGPPVSKNEK
ncbi:MAG: hypothetical protein PHX74_05195 [Candidatus Sumerlaeales bacterium]|nr:hypothetical protein [Candidatus Sumerlaeales bacterium]